MKKQKHTNKIPPIEKSWVDDIPKDLKIAITDNWVPTAPSEFAGHPDYHHQLMSELAGGGQTWDYDQYANATAGTYDTTGPRNCIKDNVPAKPTERWLGALVRFRPMYYNTGAPSYAWHATLQNPYTVGTAMSNFPGSGQADNSMSTISRLAWPDRDDESQVYLSYTGTVIDIDDQPNYKGQYHVSVLWADGPITYENIGDLEIIQPGN
jgi:hypothetical protein